MKWESRRDFLKTCSRSGLLLVGGYGTRTMDFVRRETVFCPDIGVCTSVDHHTIVRSAGCDYIEEGVRRFLIPDQSENAFNSNLEKYLQSGMKVAACNSFLPGTMKSVGPESVHEAILDYSETAFRRARKVGIETIVFGSGGSRRIPEGFDIKTAEIQFIRLLQRMADLGEKYHIIIVLEPLNRREVNFINTLREGQAIVRSVNRSQIKLLADIYHMLCEGEGPEAIVDAGSFIKHCHIAEKKGRTPPGMAGDDFRPYFRALKKVGYKGLISIESRWSDFDNELQPAVKALRRQMRSV